jgi:hypothetical protein
MKRFILFLLITLPIFSFAQQGQGPEGGMDREDRLKSLQIAYLTRELNITPAEAEKFWPVYNKYQDEMKAAMKSGKDGDVLEKQQQMLDIRKKYKPEFSKILNPERTNKLFEAEGRFRDMVKKELQERREMMEKRQQKRLN